mmetsp:Transcript_11340/g.15837  ORF Transcript_11340/g.15837 Transcript_11340/m.15837 type:complete len:1488 (+) Transcript_11340:97-4560(+)|eukprot:CAMPEP_0184480776 /NCGR_PEP_ID=MMETSP0113_2-20130426/2298_1 /TAXON_ID=91329 /ORGANISM="Norrisiella sphaerica, Strain BC52" /LENGTH=1487 /DNA_ID=CAMNT_0026859493 /DNA_START=59 /DNA_END=4522 /DNA_ORIENTATION=+
MTDKKQEEKEKPFVPNPKELDGVPDLSSLIYLEEPHVVHNVKCRYSKDLIYTGISSVLVAVNPYKQLKCYTNERINHYADKAKYEKGLPHVYNVAEDAYRQLLWTGQNQSMVVCGESGAGKTENAKYLMRHLAYTTSTGLYKSSQSGSLDDAKNEDAGSLTSAKIEQQILAANPILESFGNAKTLLNNNSSRFGKFTKLLFQKPEKEGTGGHIVGSAMETYLLEKSRVVFQAKGERNYHVFYQICSGLDEDSLKSLGITEAEDFTYLNQSECIEIPGMSDEYRFTELVEAMELLGFTKEDQSKIFCTVAAVLHLGNIEFEDDEEKTSDACKITEDSDYSVKMAAHLLEISLEDLTRRLTKQSIKIRGKVIWKEYSVEAAESNRDSTSKAIYGSLFDWVVLKINHELFLSKLEEKRNKALLAEQEELKKKQEQEQLQAEEEEKLRRLKEAEKSLKKKTPKKKLGNKFSMFENKSEDPLPPVRRRKKKTKPKEDDTKEEEPKEMTMDDLDNDPNITWIGILDVFGFECFEYNSFEQFCINFTNETLQRYFNYNIMLSEQAEYQREGIFWKPIELPDNKPTLDLINKKGTGIFSLLDAAGQMPKADDKTFTQLLFKEHGFHPRMRQMKVNPKAKQTGRQKSYINGFEIKHYAMPVCYDAKEFLIKNADRVHEDSVELFCSSKSPIVSKLLTKLKGKKSKKRTLGYVFSLQLKNLMTNLNKTKPFFVRCIKPNLKKKPGMFEDEYVANQLRCGGLIEAIKIIKCGYPTRVQYQAIFARYGPSVFQNDRKKMEAVNQRDFCEAILRSFNKNRSHFEMGLTKVFFKGQQEEFLEELMRKGGQNWKVPPDLVEKIKKHLLRKRVQRVGAFMKGYSRWLVRLRRMRAMKKWARWVRIMSIVNKTMYKTLETVRSKIATRNLIGTLRTALAVQRLIRVRRSVLFMQRYFRRSKVRSQLIAELDKRIKAKRDAIEALAANKVKGLGSDEIVNEVAKQAAKWLGRVVFKKVSENLFDGLSDGVALCQMCEKLDEKFEHKTFTDARVGSETAKRNIKASLESLARMGVTEAALFEVDDLALLKNPRKVVNAIASACAIAELNGKLPGIKAFPTVEFEIGEQRIKGKEDSEVCIQLFGENGALEDIDEERKKELIQPGYLDKKREFERKAMEMEREKKRRMAEMVERERKAKEEAERQKQAMEEERRKLEKERQEFLEWKKRKQEEEKEKEIRAKEEKKKKELEKATEAVPAETKLDPSVEQKRQFFSLTVAAVLRRFEEHGLLTAAGLTYENFNAIELLETSEKEKVPWHLWNDWVTQRVRAAIEAKLPKQPAGAPSGTSAVKQQQPLPPLPQGGGTEGVSFSVPRGGGQPVTVKYTKGNQVTQRYRVPSGNGPPNGTSRRRVQPGAGASRPRTRGQHKKSIIVSISGPKPPPPKAPPPRNAKRYHRRRAPPGGAAATTKAPVARPRSSGQVASEAMPQPQLREGSGIESDEKKECSIQ